MNKIPIFTCAILACISIRAQTVTPTVISSNGGYNAGSSGSVAWTIGEPVSETYKKTSGITTMGFHQTDMELVNFINENSQDLNQIVVFPNPVYSSLNVNFSGMEEGTYSVRVTDAAGRAIMQTDALINSSSTIVTLPFSTVAEGNYLLSIRGKKGISNIKINKVNND